MASRSRLVIGDVEDARSVILDGVTVYHDEEDRDYHNPNFSSTMVADRLSRAIRAKPIIVKLVAGRDVPLDWNFDDVEEAAWRRAGTR